MDIGVIRRSRYISEKKRSSEAAIVSYLVSRNRDRFGLLRIVIRYFFMHTKEKRNRIRYLPLYGCISTGIIYVAIGVIAILSFLKLKDGGADESSLLAFLNDYVTGKILIWVILTGTLSYIIWRIYETIKDPYAYGNDVSGIVKRTGIALSTVSDMFIAYAAIEVLIGSGNIQVDGQPEQQRELISQILSMHRGKWITIGIGMVILSTAIIQFVYGVIRGYKERLEIANFSNAKRRIIHLLAWTGYFARGIILGIIGFFFIKAGVLENAHYVVNTDKAFDFIGDHVGHFYFILVAAGTICYGLFMFTLGITYDADKD